MKFIHSEDKEEILRSIKSADNRGKIVVWQNESENRSIYHIDHIDHDPIRKIIRFKLDPGIELNKKNPVYIKLAHRNTIFKGSIFSVQENFIYLQIPDEVKLEEYREFKRYKFGFEEDRKIFVNLKTDLTSNSKMKIQINLVDISQSGIGLVVDKGVKDLVITSDAVSLSSIGQHDFKSEFLMDMIRTVDFSVRKRGVGQKSDDLHQIGFKFKNNLPFDILTDFIKNQEQQYTHQLGFLSQSKKFRKKLYREYKQMLSILLRKRSFKESFKNIERKDFTIIDYMPRHIRILSMVSCALAKLVNRSNSEMIKQLTYCSFIHDIAFYNNPKLSHIKDREHFEKLKNILSPSEKDLFLKSPGIAYEYSIADKEAPIGAEFLLWQIKEVYMKGDKDRPFGDFVLADGTALFLIAHDMTDYMLSHPDWTFYDYMRQYPFHGLSGIFEEVFIKITSARIKAA